MSVHHAQDDAAAPALVIVCGLHDEGLRIVEQLVLAGVEVVVVDAAPDARLVATLTGWRVPFLARDARLHATLADAGIERAAALVCVESDDLQALAIVLLAQEMRPEVRVVVQLRNAAVGRALEEIGVLVLDVARLAAPSVVEACLDARSRELVIGEVAMRLVETVCLRAGTLRQLYGDLAPIAVLRPGAAPIVTPGRDESIEPGDRLVVLGLPEAIREAGVGDEAPAPGRTPAFVGARAPRPPQPHRPLLWDLLAGVDRRVTVALAALAALAAVSITMLMVGYRDPQGHRMSLVDALYFTVETIGTVGFGDFYFRDQHTWLRIWAICLMIVGAALATVFFAMLTNMLVGRRIADTLGRRRVTGLTGHVIVVGAGSVGMAVIEGLRERGVEVVAVDADPGNRFLGELRRSSVPVIAADATLPDSLRAVQLGRARAVAVMTSDDLANIETGLAIRGLLGERWSDVPVVLRLFEPRLTATVAASFGFGFVRSPAALAAPWFVGAALGLEVVDTFYVGDLPLLVARLRVAAGRGLDGLAMREVPARVRVISLVRADGAVDHQPRRDTRFASGDVAALIGPYQELLRLLRAQTQG